MRGGRQPDCKLFGHTMYPVAVPFVLAALAVVLTVSAGAAEPYRPASAPIDAALPLCVRGRVVQACRHQREADLQALIDAGRGDCFPSLSDRSLSVVASHENARTRPSHICP